MYAVLAQILIGLGTAGYNAYKKKQEQNKLDALGNATYSIPQEYYDNLGLTQSEVSQGGFSPQTLKLITDQYQQGLAGSNNAILQGGGGTNDIAKLYGNFTNQIGNLAVQNDTLRNQKIQNLLQATSTLAGQDALKWKLNTYDTNRNNRAAAASLIQGYSKGVNSGINQGVQGLGGLFSYSQGDSLEKQFKKMQKQDITGNATMPSLDYDGLYANANETQNAIDISDMENLGAYNSINQYNPYFTQ